MKTQKILLRSLAVAVVIAAVIWTTTANSQNKPITCCKKVSTAEVTEPIIDIRLKDKNLPCLKAVIFKTEQGELCCDPGQRWVQKKVKQFLKNKPKRSA
ncbi:C-C motif chemokine 8-like [Garra rufa]|uniref:C-C motif chemokine 8-like n=1 Tax=Garra rufa TaxID=137080 RepID=UPI003CCE661A